MLLAAGLAAAAEGPVLYRITELAGPAGAESRAYAISPDGLVAGEAESARRGDVQAMVWFPDGGWTNLGTLGGRTSRAYAVSPTGAAAGEADTSGGVRRAFIWTPASGLRALPAPSEAGDTCAYAINASGAVAGVVYAGEDPRAARWDGPESAPRLLTASGGVGVAHAINLAGLAAGQAAGASAGGRQAFLCGEDGLARALADTPALSNSVAAALNDSGAAAGWFVTPAGLTHAFLFDPAGTLRDLDAANNAYSAAYALNGRGEAVGTFFRSPDEDNRAFLARDGALYDLNELLEEEDGWLLVEARGINGAGQIVGYGLRNGREKAFRLDPLPAAPAHLPQVRLIAPAATNAYHEPADIELAAEAASPAGLRRVVFLGNGQVLGSATEPPYRLTWSNVPAGECDLTARADDRDGRRHTSARVRVTVGFPPGTLPEVRLLTPTNGAVFAPGATIAIHAQADDPDGEITDLSVFADGANLAQTEGRTLTVTLPDGEPGPHLLRAEATDDRGARATSAVVRVVIAGDAESAPK